jgi:hypothetical protein
MRQQTTRIRSIRTARAGRAARLVAGAAALVAAVGLAAGPAAAKTVYSWVTDEGTFAFTDDAKRIPAKYREQVERRTLGKLGSYPRYTPVRVKEAKGTYPERVTQRLEHLRDQVALEEARAAEERPTAATGTGPLLGLPLGGGDEGGPSIGIPVGAGTGEPIVVEQVSSRPDDSIATRTVTVVKQGDRVLGVIKPIRNQRDVRDVVPDDELTELDLE